MSKYYNSVIMGIVALQTLCIVLITLDVNNVLKVLETTLELQSYAVYDQEVHSE